MFIKRVSRDWRGSQHEPLCCAGVEWTAGCAQRKNGNMHSPSTTNIRRIIHRSFLKLLPENLLITIRSIEHFGHAFAVFSGAH
jgi:hypothetical protein